MTIHGFASRDDATEFLRSRGWHRNLGGVWTHPSVAAVAAYIGQNAYGFRCFVDVLMLASGAAR